MLQMGCTQHTGEQCIWPHGFKMWVMHVRDDMHELGHMDPCPNHEPAIKILHWRGGQCNFDTLWVALSSPLGNARTMG